MNKGSYIPFNLPDIGEEEIREVVETLRSGWLTTGPRTARLEELFRTYTGCRHTLALSSGTAALHLALASLGIGPGDEVITTPITFCATVSAIIHVGATPVLADIRADGNIDSVSISNVNRTKIRSDLTSYEKKLGRLVGFEPTISAATERRSATEL